MNTNKSAIIRSCKTQCILIIKMITLFDIKWGNQFVSTLYLTGALILTCIIRKDAIAAETAASIMKKKERRENEENEMHIIDR